MPSSLRTRDRIASWPIPTTCWGARGKDGRPPAFTRGGEGLPCLLPLWSSSEIHLFIDAVIMKDTGDQVGDRKDEVPGPRSFLVSDTKQTHE